MARRGPGDRSQCQSWRGRLQPNRGTCPGCGKKGLGPWKLVVLYDRVDEVRSCRHCAHTEARNVRS